MFELEGKVALITGGVSGIGLAIAEELLENKLRALVLVDINEGLGNKILEELKRKYGGSEIIFVKADVRDKNNLEDAFKTTVEAFKNLDIVINSAGVLRDKIVEDQIDINYRGTVYSCILALDHYLPKYKSGDEAVILNVASITGIEPFESIPVYSSTKWAVIGLTLALGTDEHYQRTKVKVFAVCPGFTDTPLIIANDNSCLNPDYKRMFESYRNKSTVQPSIYVGKACSYIISEGGNGSVWVVDNKQSPYQHTFAKLAA